MIQHSGLGVITFKTLRENAFHLRRCLTIATLAITLMGAAAPAALGGFDGGPNGFELSDFSVGSHEPNRGHSLVHSLIQLAGSDANCPGLSLDYSIERDFSYSQHTWTWESAEFEETTEVSFHWIHEGNHRRLFARASANVDIEGTSTVLHHGRTLGPFLRQGDFTAIVLEGQTIKITVTGRHFDRTRYGLMSGSFEIRPLICEELADITPPEVNCALNRNSFWPPNNKLVDVGFDLSVSDDRDPNPSVEVLVFSDEADSNAEPDALDDGFVLSLRAQRLGNEEGRVYLIVAIATDEAGNVGYDCCTVTVPHDQSKKSRNASEAKAAAIELECLLNGQVPSGLFLLNTN